MPIYDFECTRCREVVERILPMRKSKMLWSCDCGGVFRRIITMTGEHTGNQDAPWVRTVADIIESDSKDPRDQKFLKSGMTRHDLKTWQKERNLRHMVPGERPLRPPAPDMAKINDRLTKNLIKRNRIEI